MDSSLSILTQGLNQAQLSEIIIQTINQIFSNMFSSIDNNLYNNLDNLVFIKTDILNSSIFKNLLGANTLTGLVYLANAMLVGILIYYIVRYFYSNFVDVNIEQPHQFFFKLLIFAFAVNGCYLILEQIININYFISSAIQELGKKSTGLDITFSQLLINTNKFIGNDVSSINFLSFDGILKSFISVGLIGLSLNYSLRFILLQVLILFTPFAVLSLMTYSTSWIFQAWSKSFFSLLIVQIFVPLVIIVIFNIDPSNKVLFVGGIYVLSKINSYVREIFGGISSEISGNIPMINKLVTK